MSAMLHAAPLLADVTDKINAPSIGYLVLLPIFIFGYWLIRTGRIQHSEQHREF